MNVSDPKHIHHAIWREHVQSVLDGSPKSVEYYAAAGWVGIDSGCVGVAYCTWHPTVQYRLTPRTITRTLSYPKPLRVALSRGDDYFVVDIDNESGVEGSCWQDDMFDRIRLKRGMVFATYHDAKVAADAVFGIEQ